MIGRLRYFIPKKIAEFRSPYNAYIRINEEIGGRKLLVNGSPQSGPYIETLWENAFNAFGIGQRTDIKDILVLGIAGGTVIHMLHRLFPMSSISGVDIDPVMISIGKRYFHLDSVSNLRLTQADASAFVSQQRKRHVRYDLVIVDMSFGRIIPEFLMGEPFLTDMKKILRHDGCSVINFLREMEYEKKSDDLEKQLKRIFAVVDDYGIYRNRFFFVSIV